MEDLIKQYDRAIVCFSGGVDSLAMLEYTKDFHDKMVGVYCDTGAPFPHVRQFVVETFERYGLEYYIIKSDVMRFHHDVGIPVDILPANSTRIIKESKREVGGIRMIQWTECCRYALWEPIHKFCKDSGIKLVLRGHRKCDHLNGVDSGTEEDGIKFVNPLDSWTDENVFNFLKSRDIELPKQYEDFKDSMDCYCCTAPLFGGLEKAKKRLKFMKKYYPLQYESLVSKLEDVYGAALFEINNLGLLLEEEM